ncbi:hypothetical protein [Haloquadratum walsbyi]|uniref:Uncharacterized protein n=1 Tax=Haloquadratum walsbyi (strain DSM 16790 / HBSQ001) TaxID=362976 RepID=Q18IH1_HALWD|nr:hypothetical protein [Haloquadratum walsbyi]CAJ52201.2 uncharacterized protein HQ_2074A [Haloquadratum walsbyi DSM 16790]
MPATFYYEKNDAYPKLGEGSDAPFESNTRLLIFAASVGYSRGRYVDDPAENGEIRWNYISQNQKLSVIVAALAYAYHNDAEVILKPEEQIETLRRYGAGGARVIKEQIVDEPGSNLDNLIAFIKNTQDEDKLTKQVGILEDIEEEISSLRAAQD